MSNFDKLMVGFLETMKDQIEADGQIATIEEAILRLNLPVESNDHCGYDDVIDREHE